MTLICTNVTDKWCLIEEMFCDGICVARKAISEKMKPIVVLLFGVASTFKTERLEPYVCTLCKKNYLKVSVVLTIAAIQTPLLNYDSQTTTRLTSLWKTIKRQKIINFNYMYVYEVGTVGKIFLY